MNAILTRYFALLGAVAVALIAGVFVGVDGLNAVGFVTVAALATFLVLFPAELYLSSRRRG